MRERTVVSTVNTGERAVWTRSPAGVWEEKGRGLHLLGGGSHLGSLVSSYVARALNEGTVSPEAVRWVTDAARNRRPISTYPLTTLEASFLKYPEPWLVAGENQWMRAALEEEERGEGRHVEAMAYRLCAAGRRVGAGWLWKRGKPWSAPPYGNVLLKFLERYRRWMFAMLDYRRMGDYMTSLDTREANAALRILPADDGRSLTRDGGLVCSLAWGRLGALVASRNPGAIEKWCSEAAGIRSHSLIPAGPDYLVTRILPGPHTASLAPLLTFDSDLPASAAAKMGAGPNRLSVAAQKRRRLPEEYVAAAFLPPGCELGKCASMPGGWSYVTELGDRGMVRDWFRFWKNWAAQNEADFAESFL